MKNLVLILVAISFMAGCGPSAEDIEATIDNGNVVVGEIESYKEEVGQYPDSLDVLVNDYNRVLPDPTCGTGKWEYEIFVEDGEQQFALRSGERDERDPVVLYVSNREGWVVDTK